MNFSVASCDYISFLLLFLYLTTFPYKIYLYYLATYWALYFILLSEKAKNAVIEELNQVFGSRISEPDFNITSYDLQALKVNTSTARSIHNLLINYCLWLSCSCSDPR